MTKYDALVIIFVLLFQAVEEVVPDLD